MKLEYTYGCIANSLSVDGTQEIDLTDAERRHVIERLSAFFHNHPEHLNPLLQHVLEAYGDYECDNRPCNCCGDTVTTYTLEI